MNAYTRLRRDGFQASDAVLRDDLSVINTPVRWSDGQLREQRRRNVLLFPGKDDADNSIFLDSNLCAISFVRRRDTKVLRGASETDEQFPIIGIDDRQRFGKIGTDLYLCFSCLKQPRLRVVSRRSFHCLLNHEQKICVLCEYTVHYS